MRTFVDNAGRTWTVAVTVDALKRVRSLCGVDLMGVVGDGALLDRLVADPVLLCDVVFAACKDQADAKGVSDADFGRAMAGDAIEQATTALLEALADFFPSRKRAVLQRVIEKMRQVDSRLTALAEARLADPALDEEIERAVAQALRPGVSSGDAPESSG
ncbi:MAG: hypothetical protein AB7D00_14940 [Rhodospirillaceae bacterium]